MIKIKGQSISSVVISSALGFGDGIPILRNSSDQIILKAVAKTTKTTIITKSITRHKHKGNFRLLNPFTWKYIKKVSTKTLYNNYKLTNPGVDAIADNILKQIKEGNKIVPSIWADTQDDFIDSITSLYTPIVELNFYCPNAINCFYQDKAVKAIKNLYPNIIIIAKIGYYHSFSEVGKLIDAGVDVLHAINSIPVREFPEYSKKFKEGSISGKEAFPLAFNYNEQLRKRFPLTPIIMGCGVSTTGDIRRYRNIGADSVSICSLVRFNAGLVESMLWDYNHDEAY